MKSVIVQNVIKITLCLPLLSCSTSKAVDLGCDSYFTSRKTTISGEVVTGFVKKLLPISVNGNVVIEVGNKINEVLGSSSDEHLKVGLLYMTCKNLENDIWTPQQREDVLNKMRIYYSQQSKAEESINHCPSQQEAFRLARQVRPQDNQAKVIHTRYYDGNHGLIETDDFRCVSDSTDKICSEIASSLRTLFEGNLCRGDTTTSRDCAAIQFQRGVVLSDRVHFSGYLGGDTPQRIFSTINENTFAGYQQHLRCWQNRSAESKSTTY
jgi:hypothetical protein